MSLTDIRASYRDAFQTLRNVAREAPAHRNGVAAGTSQTKPSEAPSGVVVELSSKAAKGEEKGDVQSASDNARIEALSQKKGRARAKLQELMKQLKIVRKVWQYQPRELAKQIVRLAKALKEIVTEYKAAQTELAELQASMAGGGGMPPMPAIPSVPPSGGAGTEEETEGDEAVQEKLRAEAETAVTEAEAELQAEAETGEAESGEAAAQGAGVETGTVETDAEAEDGAAETEGAPGQLKAYGAVKFERVRLDQTPEAFELRGDIDFVKEAKGVQEKLKEMFWDVKRWAIGFDKNSKDDRKLYEVTEKVLKKMDKELGDYQDDLQKAMPPAIWGSRPINAG